MHGHGLDGRRHRALRAALGHDRRTGRPSRRATRPCSTRAASSRSCKRHFARYTPEMVVAGVRLHAGGVRAGGRAAVRQLRARADQRHRLRPRLDAAHHRRADDPHRRHPAAAARQHRPARRRHHGHARPLHASRARPTSRPCTTCCPATCRSRPPTSSTRRSTPTSSTRACPPATGPTSASSSSACSRRGTATPPRRRTTSASAGCRASTATTRSCLLRPHGQGRGEGLLPLRPEPRRRRAERRAAPRRPAQPRLAGRARLVRDRERRLLEERPERPAARRDQDRGLLHPRRGRRRRRTARLTNTQRLLQWHDKALDPPGDCRSDAWFVYNLGKRLKQLYAGSTDPQGPAAAAPHLGLRLRRAAATARRHAQPDRGRAGRREGPAGDQRLQARRDRPAHRPAAPADRLLRAEGRRHDGVRLLDLQRRLPRAGPQPGPRAQAHRQPARSRSGASPGRTTAASCTTAPRPIPRAGRGRSGRSSSGGTPSSAAGSASTSRTSSPSKPPDYRPPPGAKGMARHRRRRSRSS